jgi:DNA-directed RNA polymerase specialized sigma24 family protein
VEPQSAHVAFASTHWSVVQAARDRSSAPTREALNLLCATYWQPVYAFIRPSGSPREDALDLAQGFFAALLDDRSMARADPDKGRFRSFLLGALRHYLADERRRDRAKKRGGDRELVPLDVALAETRYGFEAAITVTPEIEYDRAGALAVLDRTLARLREKFDLSGRAVLFDALKEFLTGDKSSSGYGSVAGRLQITEGAARMTVTRMRQRFRALVRQDLSHTVLTAAELEEDPENPPLDVPRYNRLHPTFRKAVL